MDWLLAQKAKIEKKLVGRHLNEGGIAMYDLSSSWVEGAQCKLAAFGYSRDGERGPHADRVRPADRSGGPAGRH
jgi:hypothetical protein